MPPRVTHVITSLEVGGAQAVLSNLIAAQDGAVRGHDVVSLTTVGPIGAELQARGVRVRALGMQAGRPDPLAVARLAHWLRADAPDLVQTWMYHADFTGGIAARCVGIPVVWGVHHTDLPRATTKAATYWLARVCARLSGRLPDAIACCAEEAARTHAALGYAADKLVVIPNGFDLEAFQPSPTARGTVRRALGLPEEALLIGQVGRYHPQKDHLTFVQAASALVAAGSDAHFVLVGEGLTWENAPLAAAITSAGLADRVHLLGRRSDVPSLTAALDLATLSSSHGEGLPNVVGEAMACGVPCVVTDVGDSARVVGDTGRVVAPRSPEALATAWTSLLVESAEAKLARSAASRERVGEHYSLRAMADGYGALHARVLESRRRG